MSWLDRQSFLGPNSEEVLSRSVVGVVGLGGGGSHVSQQLAHVGVGKMVLVDPDEMEDTNLNRLVGASWADVEAGTPKVKIAERLLRGIRPDVELILVHDQWQNALDALMGCDVIIGGLDSVRAKDELDAFCRRFLIPYIDMGMDVHGDAGKHMVSGQVVLSSVGHPCLRCVHVVTQEGLEQESRNYGAAGGLPQVVWPNGVLASTAVGLAMQLLTPWHPNSVASAYLEYDGNLGSIVPSALLSYAARSPCSHYPSTERGDPGFDVRRLGAAPTRGQEEPKPKIGFWELLKTKLRL